MITAGYEPTASEYILNASYFSETHAVIEVALMVTFALILLNL